MAEGDRKRELALPPGTYAYVLDGTKGSIKTHAGPCTLTLTNQDKPVRFNQTTYKFDDCSLEEAVQQNIVAPEGFYIELRKQAEIEQEQAARTEEQQRWLVQIQAQTDAVAKQMAAIDPNLSAALMSTAAQETLVKVSKELSFHQILGGENAVDVLRKVFANTPLEAVMLKALGSLPALPTNGAAKGPSPVA